MIKSKRRINKAMLVANVVAYRHTGWDSLAFHSIKHDDFLAIPASSIREGWLKYGYMANQAGAGGRWTRAEYFGTMGGKRVSN